MEVEWCLTKGRQPNLASTKRAKLKKQWMRGGRLGCEAICIWFAGLWIGVLIDRSTLPGAIMWQ
jgi:hypothetical protein